MPVGGTAFLGQNQHPRLTTNYLNQASRRGDPAPGVNVSTAQVSGSIVQPYGGFEGGKLTITGPWAVQFADPTVGPLYGGVYQYVHFSPLMTAPAARGAICFWVDEAQYIVTTDYSATNSFKVAGVIINPDDPDHWDFIQIAGIASVLSGAAVTVGNPVSADTAGAVAGQPVKAAAGAALDKNSLGIVVLANAVANQAGPVELNILAGWNY